MLKLDRVFAGVLVALLLFGQGFLVLAQVEPPVMEAPADTTTTSTDTTTDTATPTETVTAPEPAADTAGPVFTSVSAMSSEPTSANIMWSTDELAYGYVEYGPTTSYGQSTAKITMANMSQTQDITGLDASTVYHYRVVAEDQSGNISFSKDRTLETAVEPVLIDNAPPEITNVGVSGITESTATITMTTNEVAQGQVNYGLSESYGSATPEATDFTTEHSFAISGLAANTVYHYQATAQDEAGNVSNTLDETFTTAPAPAEEPAPVAQEPASPASTSTTTSTTTPTTTATTSPLAISQVETASISTSTAVITWLTNKDADSQINFGQTDSYGIESALQTSQTQNHQVKLSGLAPGTNYFYEVVSHTASGQSAVLGGFEFNTLAKPTAVVEPPTILNPSVESVGTSTAVIIWQTDKAFFGEVEYGVTTSYGQTSGRSAETATEHYQKLVNLIPGIDYNFQIIAQDEAGNESLYEDLTFTTKALTQNAAAPPPAPVVQPPVAVALPAPVSIIGGSGGGSIYVPTPMSALLPPRVIKVQALDSQVVFAWQDLPKNSLTKTVITKKIGSFPTSPQDGRVIFNGNAKTFTDLNLANGQKYYYSMFRVKSAETYSKALNFVLTPKAGVNQTKFQAVPTFLQIAPIFSFSKTLKQGDKSHDVAHLQLLLSTAEKFYPQRQITGYYGALTKQAVSKFQKYHRLKVTGLADSVTLRRLEALSHAQHVAVRSFAVHDLLSRDLKFGMKGDDVFVLQKLLVDFGVYPEKLMTGYFGPLTRKALTAFQKQQGINPANGQLNEVTRHRVQDLVRLQNIVL